MYRAELEANRGGMRGRIFRLYIWALSSGYVAARAGAARGVVLGLSPAISVFRSKWLRTSQKKWRRLVLLEARSACNLDQWAILAVGGGLQASEHGLLDEQHRPLPTCLPTLVPPYLPLKKP